MMDMREDLKYQIHQLSLVARHHLITIQTVAVAVVMVVAMLEELVVLTTMEEEEKEEEEEDYQVVDWTLGRVASTMAIVAWEEEQRELKDRAVGNLLNSFDDI